MAERIIWYAVTLLVLDCTAGIVWLVVEYYRIYRKYRVKRD